MKSESPRFETGLPEIDEVPDTKPEIDHSTGGSATEGIRSQIMKEGEEMSTSDFADNPDIENGEDTKQSYSRKATK